MKLNGKYSVIKYVADPIRDEALNIGVAAWFESFVRVAIDDDALTRVVRLNPSLDRDAFDNYGNFIESVCADFQFSADDDIFDQVSRLVSYPNRITEALSTVIVSDDIDAENVTMAINRKCDELIRELVKPRKRTIHTQQFRPVERVKTKLRPFLDAQKVTEHYRVFGSITDDERLIPFFANSGVNVALNVVPVGNLTSKLNAMSVADRVTFWLQDVIASGDVNSAVACVPFKSQPQKDEFYSVFERRFNKIGVTASADIDDAVRLFVVQADLDEALLGQR